nr:hypothetical protein CFP56_36330 [Quercus suber]
MCLVLGSTSFGRVVKVQSGNAVLQDHPCHVLVIMRMQTSSDLSTVQYAGSLHLCPSLTTYCTYTVLQSASGKSTGPARVGWRLSSPTVHPVQPLAAPAPFTRAPFEHDSAAAAAAAAPPPQPPPPPPEQPTHSLVVLDHDIRPHLPPLPSHASPPQHQRGRGIAIQSSTALLPGCPLRTRFATPIGRPIQRLPYHSIHLPALARHHHNFAGSPATTTSPFAPPSFLSPSPHSLDHCVRARLPSASCPASRAAYPR